VIFGKEGDSVLLGSVSLEALGFMLDPLKRELRNLETVLAELIGPPTPEQAGGHGEFVH
jgi:hypothetical protein